VTVVNTHARPTVDRGHREVHRGRGLLVRPGTSTPISGRFTSRLLYDRLPDGIVTTGDAIRSNW
jgi:hypothetical protein